MKKNQSLILLFIATLSAAGCGNVLKTPGEKTKKQWVFISIESEMSRDTSDYFYYGQLSDVTMEKLKDKDPSGFFVIDNLRYLNDSDKLELYEDNENQGYRIFKISDIQRIDPLKEDPIYTFDKEELDQTVINYLKKHPKKQKTIQ